MTADTALHLQKQFGMEARFWLSLQAACDLSRARSEGDYEAVLPRDAA